MTIAVGADKRTIGREPTPPLVLTCALIALLLVPAARAAQDQLAGVLVAPHWKDAELPRISRLLLLDRDVKQEQVQSIVKVRELPVEFDPRTGVFVARGLEPQKRFDLYAELEDGTKLEGVDLTPKLGDPEPLPREAREYIDKHFYGMNQFTNQNRILALEGNVQSAAALVELARTSAFNDGGGDAIWRIERWDYVESFGGWKPDTTKVLRRFRLKGGEWGRLKWLFVPAWGGLRPGAGERKLELPELSALVGRHPAVKPTALHPGGDPAGPAKKQHVEDLKSQKDDALKPLPTEE